MAELMRVRAVTYRYNGLGGTDDDGREYVGVIAQELEKVLPGMVTSRKAKLQKGDANDTDLETVDPSAFTYLLINAVREQGTTIKQQESRIAALEKARPPVAASAFTGGLWELGLLPLGVVMGRRRSRR